MDNQEIPTEEAKTTKKKLTEEQLKTRLKSLEKAVARKKELAELRKEEKNRGNGGAANTTIRWCIPDKPTIFFFTSLS